MAVVMFIIPIGVLIIMILYLRYVSINDPKKWRRIKFEVKMLWMGTKGNYEDAIMQSYNHVCKFNLVLWISDDREMI